MKLRTIVSPLRITLGVVSKRLRTAVLSMSLHTAVLSKQLSVEVGRFIIFLQKADEFFAGEDLTISFSKVLEDLGFVSEETSFRYTKAFNHRSVFSDGEQYFAEDYVEGAPLNQTYTEPLQVFKRISKPLTNDGAASDDPPIRYFEKVLGHGIGATDDVNGVLPGDDKTIAFFKSLDQSFQAAEDFVRRVSYFRDFSDDFSASDTDTLLVGKIAQDSAQTSSAGSLRMQSYTEDMTYFAEDYVGTTRTF